MFEFQPQYDVFRIVPARPLEIDLDESSPVTDNMRSESIHLRTKYAVKTRQKSMKLLTATSVVWNCPFFTVAARSTTIQGE